ncbi:hypothetical protein IT6_03180 [Methylacidiphilum caldifontis]|uniref:hypothetical protein n=1 Tax=Methylacidiphilum caldifontis TaxID=2795386 RepID=UPI001A8D9AE1|nr:hypothetical protein [Methylacidiphilum caldifontis]QSR89300.1 hypothetical protein IT6_03180 [Methylacidiphilum caldifontis]
MQTLILYWVTSACRGSGLWYLAVEFDGFPHFVGRALAPVMMCFFPAWAVVVGFMTVATVWAFVDKEPFANIKFALLIHYIYTLQWITCPLSAWWLFTHANTWIAVFALLYPFFTSFPIQIPMQSMIIGLVGGLAKREPILQIGGLQYKFFRDAVFEVVRSKDYPISVVRLMDQIIPRRFLECGTNLQESLDKLGRILMSVTFGTKPAVVLEEVRTLFS